jgi:hypothetical protein
MGSNFIADVMVDWKEVPPPKFKKDYPQKLLRVMKMPAQGQYIGGSYYEGCELERYYIPNGSVFKIQRRIKAPSMPAILACSWFCPACGHDHERIIQEAFIGEGKAVFVEPKGLRARSAEDGPLVIYLAFPYFDPSPWIKKGRNGHAVNCSSKLRQNGYGVISPLIMAHAIEDGAGSFGNPLREEFKFESWKTVCLRMLEACDIFCVLKLDGWHENVELMAEIEHARSLGKPISFLQEKDGEFIITTHSAKREDSNG